MTTRRGQATKIDVCPGVLVLECVRPSQGTGDPTGQVGEGWRPGGDLAVEVLLKCRSDPVAGPVRVRGPGGAAGRARAPGESVQRGRKRGLAVSALVSVGAGCTPQVPGSPAGQDLGAAVIGPL